MKQFERGNGRKGFTLIEILVALILLALTVAAVFPVVTQQIGAADMPRLGNDLASVRTGIQSYVANTQREYPDELADLVNDPSVTGWNGPYLDVEIASGALASSQVMTSGYDATLENGLFCYNAATQAATAKTPGTDCTPNWLAVEINGLTALQFAELDGAVDDGSLQNGKLRCGDPACTLDSETTTSYWLMVR